MCAQFRLTVDLTDAERYREAYHKLVDEVGVLAARNELAESEADRLSQFNAEILAHNNPAQRIVYLDRIRRELAETKQVRRFLPHSRVGWASASSDPFHFPFFSFVQMLIVATRERDAAGAQIEGLRRELSLYLSVPAEGKPRTTVTRVGRMPLVATHSENVDPVTVAAQPQSGRSVVGLSGGFETHLPPLGEDEMTLDEIM